MGTAPALTSMRQELIRAELARCGGVRIRDLMTRLGVSRATVRRDLHALIDAGEAVNARGGALLPAGRGSRDVAMLENEALAEAAAQAIVADDVKDLGLFGGPVICEVASRLVGHPQLCVVTNSLAVARVVGERSSPDHGSRVGSGSSAGFGPQVTLLPGMLHPSGVMLGSLAADALGALHLDAAYFDCAGFDPSAGASVDDLDEAALRRLAIQVSDRAALLVERAARGASGLGTFAAPGDLDMVLGY